MSGTSKNAPQEYADYILMTKLWHCTPSEFEQQTEEMIEKHIIIYNEENRKEWKDEKRREQRTKT